MRSLSAYLLACFLLLLSGQANAQIKFSVVKGQVLLQENILADAATITLIRLRDSSVISTMAIGANGVFAFNNVPPGSYCVKVSRKGCQTYTSASFLVTGQNTVDLPQIKLTADNTNLKEITVSDRKDHIDIRADKTILNIEKGGMAAGVSVLDILNSAPGVRVNSGGEILFKGGQKALIAINGRTMNLSSQDIAAQLRNMQSGDVSQIELIANPSAKYEAAGGGGVINLILKKGQDVGLNGSVTAGAGYGNFYKLTPAISLNYRTKALNFFGSYALSVNNTDHTITTDRNIGTATNFNVDYYNKQRSYASTYTIGIDHTIDAGHTLGFLVSGYFSNFFLDKNTVSAISNNKVLDSTLTTMSVLNRHISNVNYNLNYSGKLGNSNKTIAADADYYIFNRRTAEDLNSVLYNANTGTYGPMQFFTNGAPTHISNLSGKVDHVNPISKTSKLEAGLKASYIKSDNQQQFDIVKNSVPVADPFFSSRFNYRESIISAYANYTGQTSTKFDYQLGLRAEHTYNMGNSFTGPVIERRYFNLFPDVQFNYNYNAGNRFSLAYNRRIDRPSYEDLNPIIAYLDKYNFRAGNAYLRPDHQDNITLSHTYKGSLVTSLYALFVKDFNGFTYFSQNDATKTYTTGKINLKQANTYGISVKTPVSVAKWWNMNIDVNASYQHYEDYDGLLNKGTFDAILQLIQVFRLPGNTTVNLTGQYEVPTFYAIYTYRSSYKSSIAINKQVLNKRATLNFTLQDIFNTDRDRYSSVYANLNMVGYDKKETQIARLSFTYRFGKSTVKASRKHISGNSDELRRIGNN